MELERRKGGRAPKDRIGGKDDKMMVRISKWKEEGEEAGGREGDSWRGQNNVEQRGGKGELVGKEEVLGKHGTGWVDKRRRQRCRKSEETNRREKIGHIRG